MMKELCLREVCGSSQSLARLTNREQIEATPSSPRCPLVHPVLFFFVGAFPGTHQCHQLKSELVVSGE